MIRPIFQALHRNIGTCIGGSRHGPGQGLPSVLIGLYELSVPRGGGRVGIKGVASIPFIESPSSFIAGGEMATPPSSGRIIGIFTPTSLYCGNAAKASPPGTKQPDNQPFALLQKMG